MTRNDSFRRALIAGAVSLGLGSAAAAREVVLYTASNDAIEQAVLAAFSAAHPEVEVKSVNMSTGPITEKAVAEMGNPQADVIWMVNDFALERLKEAGALEPYRPAGMAVLPEFVDPDGFWIGHNATIMAMAVNRKVLAERGLPMPQDWTDLIKPIYDDQIVVAAATKSGTGFTIFSTMLDMFGWNYLDNLDANIFQYGESGSAPARQVGAGEAAIGLSYDTAVLQQVAANPDVEMVTGRLSPNIIEGAGLIAGGPNPEEGRLFMDWLFSAEGLAVFAPFVGIGAAPGVGNVDLSQIYLWELRHPLDQEEFKRAWAEKYAR